jgi:t-SNARE complex subunit (syntaxin)
LRTRFETLKVDENLRDLQNLKTDVAVLNQAEAQRDKKVRDAIESLSSSLKDLESRIQQAVRAGDRDNLRNLLTLRVGQTETAYTLSKIQGGIKEEQPRDEWVRAKNELAKFLSEE